MRKLAKTNGGNVNVVKFFSFGGSWPKTSIGLELTITFNTKLTARLSFAVTKK